MLVSIETLVEEESFNIPPDGKNGNPEDRLADMEDSPGPRQVEGVTKKYPTPLSKLELPID